MKKLFLILTGLAILFTTLKVSPVFGHATGSYGSKFVCSQTDADSGTPRTKERCEACNERLTRYDSNEDTNGDGNVDIWYCIYRDHCEPVTGHSDLWNMECNNGVQVTSGGSSSISISPTSVSAGGNFKMTAGSTRDCSVYNHTPNDDVQSQGGSCSRDYTTTENNGTCDSPDAPSGFPQTDQPCRWFYNCTAPSTAGSKTVNYKGNNDDDSCSSSARYTVSGGATTTPSPTSSPTSAPTVTPAPEGTQCYSIAEKEADLASSCSASNAVPFSEAPFSYAFKPVNGVVAPGVKTVFVKFIGAAGSTKILQKNITYSPSAVISSIDCHLSATGTGSVVNIKGANFGSQGSKGSVKVNGQGATVTSWTDTAILTTVTSQLDGQIPVDVTLDNGSTIPTSRCTIGLTTVSLNAKQQCRLPGNFAASDVNVEIHQSDVSGKAQVSQKVSLDAKDGAVSNFTPKLETGKNYTLLIKAPKSLAKKIDFKATEGTTVLPETILPVGDIAPAISPDGKINSFDTSELFRQWSLVADVVRAGDFNGDKRINSIDYACMRLYFNQSDEIFTPTATTSTPSSSPVASSSPAASSSPVASVSPSLNPSSSPAAGGLSASVTTNSTSVNVGQAVNVTATLNNASSGDILVTKGDGRTEFSCPTGTTKNSQWPDSEGQFWCKVTVQ